MKPGIATFNQPSLQLMLTLFISFSLILVLSVPFIAGQLILRRMLAANRAPATRHRLLDDLRGLEDALVEFLASSKVSSNIVSVLAARRWPIDFKALVREVREKETRFKAEHIPVGVIRAVLILLQLWRVARLSGSGFSITDLGREVYRRMQGEPCPTMRSGWDSFLIRPDVSTERNGTRAFRRLYSRRVLAEIRARSRALIQQC